MGSYFRLAKWQDLVSRLYNPAEGVTSIGWKLLLSFFIAQPSVWATALA